MNALASTFPTSTNDWLSIRNNRIAPSTIGSDFLQQPLAPLWFSGAGTKNRILPVVGTEHSFEEKIFDALVSLKVSVAAYAMHLSASERDRIFSELDNKINIEDWHKEDRLPAVHSFVQFLKWMIFARYNDWASIGVSTAGTVLVAWRTPRVLLTADFIKENEVRWTAQINGQNGEIGHTTGRCSLRLFSEQALFYLKR